MLKIIIHIILPIIVGSLIYLLFRSKSILIFDYLKLFHLDSIIDSWRMGVKMIRPFDGIVFCFPAGLWLYSYMYATGMSWHHEINTKNLFWYVLPVMVAISSELGQYFKIIRGTFDWADVACYLVSAILALFTLGLKMERFPQNLTTLNGTT
jgi:hypothetical protein